MRPKYITADAQILPSAGKIQGIIITPDGTNAATVDLYDEADSSKTASKQVMSLLSTTTESLPIMFPDDMYVKEGLYLDLTTSGTAKITVLLD